MRKLLLFLLSLWSCATWAQSVEWQRQFSVGTLLAESSGAVILNEETVYASVAVRKWGFNIPNGPSNLGLGLAKVNVISGDTFFVKKITGWTGLNGAKIHKSFEGNLVIASISVGDTVYSSQILIQKVDTNSNSVWVCPVITGYSNPILSKVIATSDGGTFILGSALSTIGGFQDFFLIKVSYDGQLQWSRRFSGGINWYCEANNIEPLRNGNYLISGMAERQVWAVEVDAEGNQVDQRTFYETPLQYLMLGGMVSQGYHKSYYAFGVIQSSPRRFYFARYDSAYSKVWGGEQNNLLGQFYANTAGGASLLLSGKAVADDSLFINLISHDSLVVWRTGLPRSGISPHNATINDVVFDGLGNAILCGSKKRTNSNRDELFFMKIAGVGLPYDPLADTVLLSTKAIQEQEKWKLYPNPATEWIRFSGLRGSAHLKVYGCDGRLVLETTVQPNTSVPIRSLPMGLYTYQLTHGGRQQSGRFLKE